MTDKKYSNKESRKLSVCVFMGVCVCVCVRARTCVSVHMHICTASDGEQFCQEIIIHWTL